jgi:hypothetical protein
MDSPARRAGLGFLRGALVAVVAQVLAVPLGGLLLRLPTLAWAVRWVRAVAPVAGFALAGAVGGDTLGAGRRGVWAFAVGGGACGMALLFWSPNLAGLTGREDALVVTAYAVVTYAGAFGLLGLIAAAVLGRAVVARSVGGFAAGGALGGLFATVPFFLARVGPRSAPPEVGEFLGVASAVGAVVAPLVIGGTATAAALDPSDS